MVRRAAESKYVAGEALHGGLERPFHEVVKVKSGFHWRLPVSEIQEPWNIYNGDRINSIHTG